MELFLAVADELGFQSDHDIAALADVGPESVGNWRTGAVKEFKKQKFQAALATLRVQLQALSAQAGLGLDPDLGLSPLEIEDGSSPSDLHRQFRDQVGYDYLGHRFLYFEPQGALAWERLIKVGYEQDSWLSGVEECCERFLSTTRDVGSANSSAHRQCARHQSESCTPFAVRACRRFDRLASKSCGGCAGPLCQQKRRSFPRQAFGTACVRRLRRGHLGRA